MEWEAPFLALQCAICGSKADGQLAIWKLSQDSSEEKGTQATFTITHITCQEQQQHEETTKKSMEFFSLLGPTTVLPEEELAEGPILANDSLRVALESAPKVSSAAASGWCLLVNGKEQRVRFHGAMPIQDKLWSSQPQSHDWQLAGMKEPISPWPSFVLPSWVKAHWFTQYLVTFRLSERRISDVNYPDRLSPEFMNKWQTFVAQSKVISPTDPAVCLGAWCARDARAASWYVALVMSPNTRTAIVLDQERHVAESLSRMEYGRLLSAENKEAQVKQCMRLLQDWRMTSQDTTLHFQPLSVLQLHEREANTVTVHVNNAPCVLAMEAVTVWNHVTEPVQIWDAETKQPTLCVVEPVKYSDAMTWVHQAKWFPHTRLAQSGGSGARVIKQRVLELCPVFRAYTPFFRSDE
jgi:hypothetical protein